MSTLTTSRMRARARERVASRFEGVENRRNARQKFNRTQKRARLLEEQARTDCRERGSLAGGNPTTGMRADTSARESNEQASGEKRFAFSGSSGKYLGRAERAREGVRARAPKGSAGTGEDS